MVKVKIFTTPYCMYCKLLKEFLKRNKIAFTEIDVSEDEAALNEMVEKSGQMGVPVTEIDNKIIVGYNELQLKRALGLK